MFRTGLLGGLSQSHSILSLPARTLVPQVSAYAPPLGLKSTASAQSLRLVLYWQRPLTRFHIRSMQSRPVLSARRPLGCTAKPHTSFLAAPSQARASAQTCEQALLYRMHVDGQAVFVLAAPFDQIPHAQRANAPSAHRKARSDDHSSLLNFLTLMEPAETADRLLNRAKGILQSRTGIQMLTDVATIWCARVRA